MVKNQRAKVSTVRNTGKEWKVRGEREGKDSKGVWENENPLTSTVFIPLLCRSHAIAPCLSILSPLFCSRVSPPSPSLCLSFPRSSPSVSFSILLPERAFTGTIDRSLQIPGSKKRKDSNVRKGVVEVRVSKCGCRI